MEKFGLLHRHLASLTNATVLRVPGVEGEVRLLVLHPGYVIFLYIVFFLCAISSAVVYLVRRRAAGGLSRGLGGLPRGLGGLSGLAGLVGPDTLPAYTKLFPEEPPPSYEQVLREGGGEQEGEGGGEQEWEVGREQEGEVGGEQEGEVDGEGKGLLKERKEVAAT